MSRATSAVDMDFASESLLHPRTSASSEAIHAFSSADPSGNPVR